MFRLTIDAREVRVRAGTVLEAARALGLHIPHLCHVPGLPRRAVCRLCLVRVDGALVPSCCTQVRSGARVEVMTPELVTLRKRVMELVVREHGACGRPGCEVEALADALGVARAERQLPSPRDLGSEEIAVHPDRCVHCDRCIRACPRGLVTRSGRGPEVGFAFGDGRALGATSCVACGDCVAACPAGALVRVA